VEGSSVRFSFIPYNLVGVRDSGQLVFRPVMRGRPGLELALV
jgi:hypothetical protein